MTSLLLVFQKWVASYFYQVIFILLEFVAHLYPTLYNLAFIISSIVLQWEYLFLFYVLLFIPLRFSHHSLQAMLIFSLVQLFYLLIILLLIFLHFFISIYYAKLFIMPPVFLYSQLIFVFLVFILSLFSQFISTFITSYDDDCLTIPTISAPMNPPSLFSQIQRLNFLSILLPLTPILAYRSIYVKSFSSFHYPYPHSLVLFLNFIHNCSNYPS